MKKEIKSIVRVSKLSDHLNMEKEEEESEKTRFGGL